MPRPGFYNDNEYRAYPFIFNPTSVTLPESSVVDAGVVMRIDANFNDSVHTVWLHSVVREGDVFKFELRTDATDEPLIFTRSVTAQEWQIEYAESAPKSTATALCPGEPVWEGFLVTGPLGALGETLPAEDTLELPTNAYQLEPATVQNLNKSYLRTISVGNYERTKVPACGSGNPADVIVPRIILNKRCMAGNLKFKEGYNCTIEQIPWTNEIIIGAGAGGSTPLTGEICENGSELRLYPEEALPEGSQFLGGGPACDELIFTLNGLGGPTVTLTGGPGISITTQTSPPKITISRNTSTFKVCAPQA